MFKKFICFLTCISVMFLCLPVFSSAAVYDISGSVVNNFLIYDSPENVTFIFDGSESLDLSQDIISFNESYINSYTGLFNFTAISGCLITISMPSLEFIQGQSYDISFELSSGTGSSNCAFAVPSLVGTQLTAAELIKMNIDWIQDMNTPLDPWDEVLNYFSVFNKNDLDFYHQCNAVEPVFSDSFSSFFISHNITFPLDYVAIEDSPHTIVLFLLWRSVDPQYMHLKNFKITPVGGTKYLFDEAQFRDDVRDGILNIEGSFDELQSNLFEGGTSREPAIGNKDEINNVLQNEAALNKDFSGDLNQQFDIAGNIFEGNSSFSFISNLFQDVILSVPQLNSLIIFSLAIGLCVLILGRRLNA
ncbi:MAG: hypothetical protein J6A97_00730 [Clostridia bacterium]|nr:hypothetical protein [Clostridia bacterium]